MSPTIPPLLHPLSPLSKPTSHPNDTHLRPAHPLLLPRPSLRTSAPPPFAACSRFSRARPTPPSSRTAWRSSGGTPPPATAAPAAVVGGGVPAAPAAVPLSSRKAAPRAHVRARDVQRATPSRVSCLLGSCSCCGRRSARCC